MTELFIVEGAPLSGKTSHVRENAGANDLVYDFDVIMKALTGGPLYQRNQNLISYVDNLRYTFFDVAKENGIKKVWIITTRVNEELQQLADDHAADVVKMLTSKADCLERLESDDARTDKDYWTEQIEKYFLSAGWL